MWFVYILKCVDNTLYTGITNDLEKRLQAHNDGTGAKYTRGRRPVEVVFKQEFYSKSDAMKEEMRIKKLNRSEKLILLKENRHM